MISLLNLNISDETPEFSFSEIIQILIIGIGFFFETDIAVSELRIFVLQIFEIIFGEIPDVEWNNQ